MFVINLMFCFCFLCRLVICRIHSHVFKYVRGGGTKFGQWKILSWIKKFILLTQLLVCRFVVKTNFIHSRLNLSQIYQFIPISIALTLSEIIKLFVVTRLPKKKKIKALLHVWNIWMALKNTIKPGTLSKFLLPYDYN